MRQFGPVRMPIGPKRRHYLKVLPLSLCSGKNNLFSTNRMHKRDLKEYVKKFSTFRCHFEVSILTHFGIFCRLGYYMHILHIMSTTHLIDSRLFYVQIEQEGYDVESSPRGLSALKSHNLRIIYHFFNNCPYWYYFGDLTNNSACSVVILLCSLKCTRTLLFQVKLQSHRESCLKTHKKTKPGFWMSEHSLLASTL